MSAEPLEGFWGMPKAFPKSLYHFFIEGSSESLCGKWRAREMDENHETRPPGNEDCNKCIAIYREIFATQIPADPEPNWTVKTDPIEGNHTLYYQGKPQSTVRGSGGLATQKELAAIFNKNGTLPKKQKKVRCAADAKDPGKYVAKNAMKSPELPLETPPSAGSFAEKDFPELVIYLRSLFDDSPVGSVPKPVFFEEVLEALKTPCPRWSTPVFLMWMGCLSDQERDELQSWLPTWLAGANAIHGMPLFLADFLKEEPAAKARAEISHLLNVVNFVIRHVSRRTPITPPTPPQETMPAKAKPAPAESTAHVVETAPASHFKRYANNRNISADVVEKMTASIREVGILQPLIGRVIAGDPMIEIIGGETRWLGASAIDPEFPIPYFARTLTDKEAARLHAVENFQRQDLNDVEQAREIQNMLDCGWEMQEIMSHLGKEKDYLYRRLNLLKLPEEGRTAVLEGNLSLFTASKILMLPEESREEAIKAVTEPVHAARALPEREAIKLIQERFIDPMEKADEWEQRRDLLEKENPGCVWLKYEHAFKAGDHNSEYVRADDEPDFEYLSDPARHNELVVPTWKELAQKHGSPIYIGFNRWNKEVQLYVSPVAIVEAEKSACDDKPEDCIFTHEKAVQKNRAEAEKRKLEEERQRELKFQHKLALEEEETRMVALVLAPDGLSKTTSKKLVDRAAAHNVLESYIETDDLRKIFQIERTEDYEGWSEKTEAAFAKYLKNKALDPFEALGRVVIAGYLTSSYCNYTLVFESGLCKPADFPASHEEYQQELARAAELAAQKAPGFADGEPSSNREENAA